MVDEVQSATPVNSQGQGVSPPAAGMNNPTPVTKPAPNKGADAPKEKEAPKDRSAVSNPGDPGYDQKVASVPDVGGFVNVAPTEEQIEERFYDDTLSQQTLDEMEAGRQAISRRGTPGRRKDAVDVAEANQRAAQARANSEVK